MKRIVLLTAISLTMASAHATEFNSAKFGLEISSVLASENLCDLTFRQDKIADFVSANVPPTDMEFTSRLETYVNGNISRFERMSPSTKTAHCTQIKRVAKSYGFTE